MNQPGCLECVILGANKFKFTRELLLCSCQHWRISASPLCAEKRLARGALLAHTVKSILWSHLSWIKWFSAWRCSVVGPLIHVKTSHLTWEHPYMPIGFGSCTPFNPQSKWRLNTRCGKSSPRGSLFNDDVLSIRSQFTSRSIISPQNTGAFLKSLLCPFWFVIVLPGTSRRITSHK